MSTAPELAIKNARVFAPDGIVKGGVSVRGGKITRILKPYEAPPAEKVIDAKGRLLLPGLIDAHVHIRDPGTPYREDFESGTRAAAAGGVTTIFEMPISTPSVHSAEILRKRVESVKGKALVDFALYGAAGADNVAEIPSMAEAGAIAFKTFMTHPPVGREREYEGLCAPDSDSLMRVLKAVKRTGLPVSVHAEESEAVNARIEMLQKEGRRDPMAHVESRPSVVEEGAMAKVIGLSKTIGTRLHIAHMSTGGGVEIVRDAKRGGQALTVETCPHYLLLTEEAMRKYGPYAKINPPLRKAEDVEALWAALNNGVIDIVASDHAPYAKEEKEVGWKDIWKALSGIPQLELTLPLMLNEVNKGRTRLEVLVKALSENVAKIFGVYFKKGAIQVGSDADLVLVDLDAERTIDASKLHTKAKETTIYDSWRVKGIPITTVVRGSIVMDDGEVVGKPGWGQFLRPLKS